MFLTKKIVFWASLNVVLLLAIAFSLLQNPQKSSLNESVDFAIRDENIDQIRFGKISLQKSEKMWLINEKLPADLPMVEDFKKILANIEIKRPVPDEQKQALSEKIAKNGIKVEVFGENNLLKQFVIFGEDYRTFAAMDEAIFEVYTPNFNIFLFKVFTLLPHEWRDKTLIAINWNSVKSLEVQYAQKPENDIKVAFDSAAFHLEGVQKIDSARLFAYFQLYQNVRAYEYIDRKSLSDSLDKMEAFCQISVEDILSERNRKLFLYKTDALYGKIEPSGQVFRLSKNFAKYLAVRKDFEKKP